MKKNDCFDWELKVPVVKKLLRIMKLTAFLLLISVFSVLANKSYSQTLSLNMEKVTLKEVLSKIEDISSYNFMYSEKFIDVTREVSINVENKKIEDVLNSLFAGTDISFERKDRIIILLSAEVFNASSGQQHKSISGKVTDSSGATLPGVSVIVKGTTTGVITDNSGNYSLSNIPENATLQFSFVGMKTQEVKIIGKSIINAVMQEETVSIEEIVAIGYGTTRKNDFTGSVNNVKIENSPLSSLPNINAMEALKGSTPGLDIGAVNSAGGSPDMLIRGQKSINGSNTPLIVLDGVIFMGNIEDINPNDIATFDILKDASSAAVYGSRAANGVIIITTKRGKTNKPVINISSSTGISAWQQKPKLRNGESYLKKSQVTMRIDDPLVWMEETEEINYKKGIETNWLDFSSRIAPLQNDQVSVSGRGEGINYYLSGGYTNQKGVIIGDDFKRISISGKINTNITKWLQIGVDGTYNFSDYSGMGADLYQAETLSPYGLPYRDEKNKLLEKYPQYQAWINPLWGVTDGSVKDIDKRNFYRFSSFVSIDIPYIKGLNYRLNYVRNSTDYIQDRFYYEDNFVLAGYGTDRYSPKTVQNYLSSAYGYTNRRHVFDYVFDNIISYKKKFDRHFLDVTLVATRDYQADKLIYTYGSNFKDNGNTLLGVNGLMKASTQQINMNNVEKANIGYLSRLSYSYNDTYHLTASLRRDGASVFGADKKWGNFSSLGIAWTASNENFIKNLGIINYLKLKASYGKNGNQGIEPYGTLSKITSGTDGDIEYEFSNSSNILHGLQITSLGNSSLGWETTTSFNGGFESSLFNKHIFLDVDFYFSKTTDQLFQRQIPPMSGFTSIMASLGQVNNRGIEVNLRTVNLKQKDWNWTSNLIFWQNRNVLKKLYGDDINGDGIEDDDISNGLFIGKSLGAIYGYEFNGIVQQEDIDYMSKTSAVPGDVKFKDLNGDGKIDPNNDRKILGYSKENFRLSLSNSVQYKNFELYVLVSGIFGGSKDHYLLKSNTMAYQIASGKNDNGIDHIWWTAENRSNTYPGPLYNNNTFLGLQSRAFVRIQDITLSYNFNKAQLQYLKLDGLKVYLGIKNLYTFTHWIGGDPEMGVQAMSTTYPVATTYSLGINISF